VESIRRNISIRNCLAELERANSEVGDSLIAAGAVADDIRTVNLGLEEVITNILKYGYDDGAEHVIQIALNLHDSELRIEVTDDGRKFNPLEHPEPNTRKPAEQREPGGLGIEFLRRLFDRMDYQREGACNRLVLHKRLHPK
jgi:anti-sigma regulatory factor (Ser/Thr protein kinase)